MERPRESPGTLRPTMASPYSNDISDVRPSPFEEHDFKIMRGIMLNSQSTLREFSSKWRTRNYSDTNSKDICDILELIQERNVLVVLEIKLVYVSPEIAPLNADSQLAHWPQFATLLGDEHGFPRLKEVSLILSFLVSSAVRQQMDSSEYEILLTDAMAPLSRSSRLTFDLNVIVSEA
ncbi:hypothetical protein CVT24_002483 [Panaeolus cyanescens]|uniref:Uncharacterized protein n=1 Tax=Panaeolus cyanescens TaxID=181874 RepID=A0A409YTP9_9AGAR|nr:hypothetical protein CVT24_002483 [Panaeolus cyanescens]